MVIEVKPLQLAKQKSPKDVTEEGISTEVKPLHFSKQSFGNEVRDEGIETEIKLLQSQKQLIRFMLKEDLHILSMSSPQGEYIGLDKTRM